MRGIGILVLAALAIGCSDPAASPGAVLGATPSSALNSAADNSCPHDVPAGFSVSGYGTRLDFNWSPVPNISDYEIEIDRYEVTNAWVMAAKFITQNAMHAEWRGTAGSKYRARLRTRTACGTFGVWTPYGTFAVDQDAKTPSDPPAPPVPPVNPEGCESQLTSLSDDSELPSCACGSTPQSLETEEPQGPSCPSLEE